MQVRDYFWPNAIKFQDCVFVQRKSFKYAARACKSGGQQRGAQYFVEIGNFLKRECIRSRRECGAHCCHPRFALCPVSFLQADAQAFRSIHNLVEERVLFRHDRPALFHFGNRGCGVFQLRFKSLLQQGVCRIFSNAFDRFARAFRQTFDVDLPVGKFCCKARILAVTPDGE